MQSRCLETGPWLAAWTMDSRSCGWCHHNRRRPRYIVFRFPTRRKGSQVHLNSPRPGPGKVTPSAGCSHTSRRHLQSHLLAYGLTGAHFAATSWCRSDWSRSCRRQHLRKRMQSHAADVHSTAIPASKAAPPKMHGKAQKLLMTIVRQLQNVDMIAAKRVKSDTRQRLGHKHPNIPHRSETHATNTECEAILNQHPHQPVQVQ